MRKLFVFLLWLPVLCSLPLYAQHHLVDIVDRPEGGFVISVGQTGHIIGYSEKGTANDALKNKNMASWLKVYGDFLAALEEKGFTQNEIDSILAARTDVRKWSRRMPMAIEPLVTTQWGQTSPYWNYCPIDAQGYNCHTGCVATAMAQVMNYHQWPAISQGTGLFIHPTYGETPYEFGQEFFDWENMLPAYGMSATQTQNDAVAFLMHECGAAVDMQYTSFGSSAYVSRVAHGLVRFMGYSRSARYLRRDWMSSDEWDSIIRDELEAGRPVVFGGQSGSFGHCFVIDGIDSDGFLHVNWGWEGNGDGFYDVNYLFPEGTEATSGFNYTQEIVVGVCPPGDNEDEMQYLPCLYLMGDLSFSNATPTRNGSFTLAMNNVYNCTGEDFDGLIGVALFSDGQFIRVLKSVAVTLPDLGKIEKKTLMLSIPDDVPDGEYEVRAVSQTEDDEEWIPMATHVNSQGVVSLTVSDNGLQLVGEQTSVNLQLEGLSMPRHRVLPGSEMSVILSVRNDGDANYNGQVGLALVDAEGQGLWSQVKPLMAYGHRTINTVFTVNVPAEEGLYYFVPAYLDINTSESVYFEPNDTVDMTLEVTDDALDDLMRDLIVSETKHVRKSTKTIYKFSAKVTNNSDETVNKFVLNYNIDNGSVIEKEYNEQLQPGESTTIYLSNNTLKNVGKHYFSYNISSVDGAPDRNPDNSSGTVTVKVVGTLYERRVVVEEGTGTWCGFCPQGIVAVELMKEKYPDTFIPIAIHCGEDPLVVPTYMLFADNYFTAYPGCVVNRGALGFLTPSADNLQQAVDFYVNEKADASVEISSARLTADGEQVETEVSIALGYPDHDAHYRVVLVLLENGVDTDGEGNPLTQTNYYVGGTNGTMGGWENRSAEEPWIYDDVARQIYGADYEGFLSSLPSDMERDVAYVFDSVVPLPDMVLRADRLSLVAMVVDTDTHEIINADRMAVGPADETGIQDLEYSIRHRDLDYYDLNGHRLSHPVKGIIIKNGKKWVNR